jgi:hypothetical protein
MAVSPSVSCATVSVWPSWTRMARNSLVWPSPFRSRRAGRHDSRSGLARHAGRASGGASCRGRGRAATRRRRACRLPLECHLTGIRTERRPPGPAEGILRNAHGGTSGQSGAAQRQTAKTADGSHADVGQLMPIGMNRDVADVEFTGRQFPQVEVIAHADVIHGAPVRGERRIQHNCRRSTPLSASA